MSYKRSLSYDSALKMLHILAVSQTFPIIILMSNTLKVDQIVLKSFLSFHFVAKIPYVLELKFCWNNKKKS